MLDLIMVIHCHQPVGNFDEVFDLGHKKCYRPLLELLEAHPAVKVGLHFSGPLFQWFDKNKPDTLDLLAHLIERGQVEPLSGGFFEPLLSSIPARDARGQVLMMNHYIIDRFGFEPKGLWLTERIWDPSLPLTLAGTGMTYTVVDDTHFYYAGLKPEEIYGRYITEKQGQTMSLFATPMTMRYLIPFKPVDEVLGYLRELEIAGRRVVVYGDDGEKFGLWPGTHDWVIRKGWLKNFFSAIANNSEWLRTVLPGDFMLSTSPAGRLYPPQASYEEMTEWALPPARGQALEDFIGSLKAGGGWEELRPFVRGGVWDNFLVKYDEANRMHKKMVFLSEKIEQDSKARVFLWRAQCNCAYWHGVFGGLYLGHLRRAIHENLIQAQKGMMPGPGEDPCLHWFDLDKDEADEILIWNSFLSLGLDPVRGGGLFEICHVPQCLNLSDTLTRRPEAYHRRLFEHSVDLDANGEGIASIHDLVQARDKDLESMLIYDSYPKASLLDHFLEPRTTLKAYSENKYNEMGDFTQGQYLVEQAAVSSGRALVKMTRNGSVDSRPLTVTKLVRIEKGAQMTVDYEFKYQGDGPVSYIYGCEFNLTLYSEKDPERYYRNPESDRRREISETGVEKDLNGFELVNGPDRLTAAFAFSRPLSVWFFPLMTISQSEEGFESTYQGSSLLFLHPLNLNPGDRGYFQIKLELI
ncbi:MAG: alpha-amylase/4-alpha-glucanotransferase domain-containing protein [Thermodesulfobacteriota bacterium]|nr:alpha-amylase/4-alpha-glucanotransferase domain-containing protein [Thermodesulfobacteriota bacterium]